ncbi:filamentous hemagglutinin N-terminal domain-containing protein [Methyloglobulus sp.]|uniref:two-partner secretion domain-containing protein n=1 Tax=Methyloglobulus sp. TaxID=2518622 RepID=UPI0032B81806
MNKKTILAVICFLTISTPCLAEITTDGTVGPKGQLSGPQFRIGQELGSLRGNNLFHSFGRFNLNSSESATFTGNSHIQNVISRVTGGALSSIAGTLKSEIGSAAFYFINPAGIVFGQNTQIDVPGAFYASTAGELKFADGTKFSADHPQANTVSMAAPEAFGFLGKQTGTMDLNGAELVFKPGTAVQLSAAKITMDKASLTGEGMDLQLAAVGDARQDVGVATLPNQALAGAISINNTVLDASGNGKGRIAVRAGDVKALKSGVFANNNGNDDMPKNQGIDMRVDNLLLDNSFVTNYALKIGDAGTITVNAQKELTLINRGTIASLVFNEGYGGAIVVKAGKISIGEQKSESEAGILSLANEGTGKAGTVNVTAEQGLSIFNSGFIATSTFTEGDAGNITVKAGEILINGHKSITPTGIFSDANVNKGNAGIVNISVERELKIYDGGRISTITFDKGNAGTVNVEAEKILIDNSQEKLATGIASVNAKGSSGKSGNVNVTAQKELVLANAGVISTNTSGTQNAGNVMVKSGSITIDGQNSQFLAGITSDSNSVGDAGTVRVSAEGELKIVNGGRVSSITQNDGDAGIVNVKAETIKINNLINPGIFTGISSAVAQQNRGSPGVVNVTATKSISMTAGDISISSGKFSDNLAKRNAKITVTAPQLNLNNNSHITTEALGNLPASPIEINTSQLSMDNSSITTAANQGDGGPITINANDWVQLKNSLITTSVANSLESFGTNIGNGGDITLNTDVLVMDTGFIQANTNAKNASGGNINLNVKQLVASNGNLQSGDDKPLTFKPNSGINVIQAASPNGINGTITNTAPQLNIVGALAGLNTPQLDLNRVGHDPCSSTVQQSTMKKLGKGGIPYFNKGQDGYTLDRLLPKKQDRPSQTTYLSQALPHSHDCQLKTKHPRPQGVTKQAG